MTLPRSRGSATEDIEQLRMDCVLGSKVGICIFSGLAAMAYRDHGTDDLFEVWRRLMSGAQSDRLIEGMRKLGIRDDEPPAVRAAKYHYFSNNLGGLNLEYIEESPKKVWLRYRGPYQMMPGITAIVFPPTLRRFQFSSWHPKNRHFLHQPRLGWVYTKTTLEGDPYDEGYFIEYDHDITDLEADGSQVVVHTPEFDPARAPRLDPVEWPEARQLKARRNYALGYVGLAIDILLSMYGRVEARHMVEKTMKILATQHGNEWISFLGIRSRDLDAAAALVNALLRAQAQDPTMSRTSGSKVQFKQRVRSPYDERTPDLREAIAELYVTSVRHLSGRVRVTWRASDEQGVDEITLEDTGQWLW